MIFVTVTGMLLVLIGLWAMLSRKNLVKIVIGFSIIDTGIHLILVSMGYIEGKTAPILNDAVPMADRINSVVDPIPSALVLTAIVIGLAVTALMLTFVLYMWRKKGSVNIEDFAEQKW